MIIKVWNSGSDPTSNFIEVASIFCKIKEFGDIDELAGSLNMGDVVFLDYDFNKKTAEKILQELRAEDKEIFVMIAANSMSAKQLSKHQNGKNFADLYLKTPIQNSFFEAVLIANFDYEPTGVTKLADLVNSQKLEERESVEEEEEEGGELLDLSVGTSSINELDLEDEFILGDEVNQVEENLSIPESEEDLDEMLEHQLSQRAMDLSRDIQNQFDQAYTSERQATKILRDLEESEIADKNNSNEEFLLNDLDPSEGATEENNFNIDLEEDSFDLSDDELFSLSDDNDTAAEAEDLSFDSTLPGENDLEYPVREENRNDEFVMEEIGEIEEAASEASEVLETRPADEFEMNLDTPEIDINADGELPDTVTRDVGSLDMGSVDGISLEEGDVAEVVPVEDDRELALGDDIPAVQEKEDAETIQAVERDDEFSLDDVPESMDDQELEEELSVADEINDDDDLSLDSEESEDALSLGEDDLTDDSMDNLDVDLEADDNEDFEEVVLEEIRPDDGVDFSSVNLIDEIEEPTGDLELAINNFSVPSDEDLALPDVAPDLDDSLLENDVDDVDEEEIIFGAEENVDVGENDSLEIAEASSNSGENLTFEVGDEITEEQKIAEEVTNPGFTLSESFQEKLDEIDEMMVGEAEEADEGVAADVAGDAADLEEDATLLEEVNNPTEEVASLQEAPSTQILSAVNMPPMDVIKEQQDVTRMKDSELERLGETIKALREDREMLLQKIDELELKKDEERKEILDVRSQLDEKKIELTLVRKRTNQQVEELKYQSNLMAEKKSLIEEKNRNLQFEIEKLNKRVKIDLGKVKNREKELESKLELLRSDASVQIRHRDQKILELKRKIDTMEFDMETMLSKEKATASDNYQMEEKMDKIKNVLKSTLGELEEDSHMAKALKEVKKSLDV